jgi:CYTH domain-containing protein
MPIENERKFVLRDPDGSVERVLAALPDAARMVLRQAYLESSGVRIREVSDATGKRALFTFKRTVEDGVVEIETPISAEDFARLWQLRRETLVKVRYHLAAAPCGWDIDFFKDGGSDSAPTYFAMAECEMPEGWTQTPPPPAVIAGHVLHTVTNGDERYTSKRLADIAHARGLMAHLLADQKK